MGLKSIPVLILFLFSQIFFFSCDSSTDPPPEEKPPGYQEDVPWASLANSPWPMYHHDPQNTGRSSVYPGPLNGEINWVVDSLFYLGSSVVIGNDSTIYVSSEPYFYAFNFDGSVKWHLLLDGYYTVTTPVVLSDNSIIIFYGGPHYIYRISQDGAVVWKLQLDDDISSQFNVGKDGTIYFISNYKLYAVGSDGTLKWTENDEIFGQSKDISFSPDGNTIYFTGKDRALVAYDINDRSIKWKFGSNGSYNAVLVDSQGNTYFSCAVDTINNGNIAMFSLSEDGAVRWFYPHNEVYQNRAWYPEPTMDKQGNLYFGADTVYSLSYNGQLRWKKQIGLVSAGTSFVSDISGNIYVTTISSSSQSFGIVKINANGDIIWQTADDYFPGESSSGSPALADGILIMPTQDKFIYSIK
jgi:hypothetical protein